MPSLNRRNLLGAATAACACALCPVAQLLAAETGTVDAGPVGAFDRDGVYGDWIEPDAGGVLIVRRGGRLVAMTSTCSHKEFTLAVKGGQIVCPKHGSRFGPDGRPTKAPARKPLTRYGISVNRGGRVVVDKSRRFGKGDWGKPGSYVEMTNDQGPLARE